MKIFNKIPLSVLVILLICGCELDNYEPPSSELRGQVLYNGVPVPVASGEVELELWQPGYELDEKIPVNVNQNGSFTAMLFDGEYKLTQLAGNGPWVTDTDTVEVDVRGNTTVDFTVEPYYVITNESISYNNGAVEASFNVNEINDSQSLEFVGLYVGTTSIVDQFTFAESEELDASSIGSLDNTINLSVNIPNGLTDEGFVFARVGVKIVGVSQMLYSPVMEISL